MDQPKPFEVEICVAQVGATEDDDELYRLTYDGSVQDEPGVVAMGGQAEAISGGLRERHRADMSLGAAVRLAVSALGSVGGEGGQPRQIAPGQLEVAILDRRRTGRTFRRIIGAALTPLLDGGQATAPVAPAGTPAAAPAETPAPAPEGPQVAEPGRTPADASPGGTDPTPAGGDEPPPGSDT
jgi:proteasome alpha subunit